MGASQSRRGGVPNQLSAFARGDDRVANSGHTQFVIAGPAAARDKKKTGELVMTLHFDVEVDGDETSKRDRRALAASKDAIKRHIRSPVLVADMRNRFFGDIRADQIALEYDFIEDVEILRREDVVVRAHDVRRHRHGGGNDMTVALVLKYRNTHALTFSETCAVLAGQIRLASTGGGVIQHPDRPSDYELEDLAHRGDLVPVIKKAVFEPVRRRE